MEKDSVIYVAGGDTLIGAALLRQLERQGYLNVIGAPPCEPDLCRAAEVDEFFRHYRPEYVIFAAGKSRGIQANRLFPADLMLDNLLSECHVIDAAHRWRVQKLLYLASSCAYPKHCPQPMRVESLMTGPLEPTNGPYATAKLAGIALCQSYARQHGDKFICGIPANAFGIDDDFSPEGGHVIPALIGKIDAAKCDREPSVSIWGTGTPRREFIFADDLADACLFVLRDYDDPHTPINLGSGTDLSIREMAERIQNIVGYTGKLVFDPSKPDGMPLKSLDSTRLTQLGWRTRTSIDAALEQTYKAFLHRESSLQQDGSYARAAV